MISILKAVDVSHLTDWIILIPFEDWPQQHRLADGLIRPAMVTDLAWHGFGKITESLVQDCLPPGCAAFERMLSVVMPGHHIPPHVDRQNKRWRCRIHVPLLTNPQALFISDGKAYQLEVGKAYCIDTTKVHEVRNNGAGPRIHLIFDVQ